MGLLEGLINPLKITDIHFVPDLFKELCLVL